MRIWSTKTKDTLRSSCRGLELFTNPKKDTELEWLVGPGRGDRWAGTTGFGEKNPVSPLWPALLSELCYWWRIARANSNLQIQLKAPNELSLQQTIPGCELLGVRLEAIREDPYLLRKTPSRPDPTLKPGSPGHCCWRTDPCASPSLSPHPQGLHYALMHIWMYWKLFSFSWKKKKKMLTDYKGLCFLYLAIGRQKLNKGWGNERIQHVLSAYYVPGRGGKSSFWNRKRSWAVGCAWWNWVGSALPANLLTYLPGYQENSKSGEGEE